MAPSVWENVSLRFWHAGRFSVDRQGVMLYVGGQGKTYQKIADELCYWEILDMAKKTGDYSTIQGVFYQLPGMGLQEGLRKVEDDSDVLAMGEIAMKYRTVDLYVLHQESGLNLIPSPQLKTVAHYQPLEKVAQATRPHKLIPKKGPSTIQNNPPRSRPTLKEVVHLGSSPVILDNSKGKATKKPSEPNKIEPTTASQPSTSNNPKSSTFAPENSSNNLETQESNIDDYDWIDPRPDSPLTYKQLFSDSSEDEDDPVYQPEIETVEGDVHTDSEDYFEAEEDELNEEVEAEENEVEQLENELVFEESDTSDEEYHIARNRVKTCQSRLLEIAEQLQAEAAEGKLVGQQPKLKQPARTKQRQGDTGYESEYYDSDDDLDTPPGSEDECEGGRRSKRALLVGSDTDFKNFEWKVGQRFASREDFKKAVAKYAILQGRNLGYMVSNMARRQELGVKCGDGCPFYLYSSWHSRKASFIVKRVVNEHKCQRNMKKNRQLTTKWAAKEMLEVFKARPHWPATEIKGTIKRAYKALVSCDFAYKAKYKAHKLLHGSMREHYMKVGRYIAALKKVSPDTVLGLVVDGSKKANPPIFQRFFNCFDGLVKGWKEGCRRIICVDAAFLKTFLGGQILSAVGRDANDQMFPIAWAVVEGENTSSWEWFFNHLQSCLDLGDGSGLAIVSDEHQAILSAVATVLPEAEHRHCARHVYANWHKHFRGDEMKLAFWKIAKAYNMSDYNDALSKLQEVNPDAAASFIAYNPENFCRAYMNPLIKSDAITNNMAETFNGYIINARTKHLLYMMEEIRVALMQRVCTKRQEMEKKSSLLCPRIQSMLDKEKEKAAMCEVMPSTENIFNVSYFLDTLVVNLENKSCTCKRWDLLGVPCCHAVACIYFLNGEAELFVDDCYKRETYLKSYANPIPACEGERHWPMVECPLDPPPIKIGPGRPRKNRIKDPFEDSKRPGTLTRHGMEMTCSLCKVKGHNKRKCPNKETIVPQEPPPKKARGRPRKYPPSNVEEALNENCHHSVSALPSQLGRGGRMILGGVGSRGKGCGRGNVGRGRGDLGGTSRGYGGAGMARSSGTTRGANAGGNGRGNGSRGGRGRGKGRGRNQVPIGAGVYIGDDGTPFSTVNGRAREINVITNKSAQLSQASTVANNTQ